MRPFLIRYQYKANAASPHQPPRMEMYQRETTVYSTSIEGARHKFVSPFSGQPVTILNITDLWNKEAK